MAHSVSSRGHRISYRTDGDPEGAPLVLSAGFSRWADNWWDVGYVGELRDGYRAIAIDEESLAHNDPAALAATVEGSADWAPAAQPMS